LLKREDWIEGKLEHSFLIAEDREFDLTQTKAESDQVQQQSGGGLDQNLFNH
jgi:ATP-dependent DNA helicase RecQ